MLSFVGRFASNYEMRLSASLCPFARQSVRLEQLNSNRLVLVNSVNGHFCLSSTTHTFLSGQTISVTYSVCMSVALDTQDVRSMRRIILLHAACLDKPYLFSLSHKRYGFRKIY
jgi:hypothetical protein